jgi:PAS domain S-box-containing protein
VFRNWATGEESRQNRERLRALSASAPVGIFETDASALHNLYSNQRMQEIFGLTAREIIDGHWRRLIHPEDRAKVMAAWKAAHRQRAAIFVECRIVPANRSTRWVKLLASPMLDTHGRTTGFVGTVDDVTESHVMMEALRESENKHRSVVINLKEVVFQTDAAGLWAFLNPAWTEITGFTVGESLGTLFLDYVHPDDRERNQRLFTPLIQRRKEYCRHEVRYLTKDGGFRWIEVFARLSLDEADRIIGTTGTLNDITARKEAEDRIAASLREKELLLKEVNHRVKNNMQVICSLLNLQAGQVEDAAVREMFAEAQNRIASMALVHEKLYQSSDLGQIDFADYLRELTDNLKGLQGSRTRNIRLELATPPLRLGIDTAIPCGLIINELVTNAYKHAFPNDGVGRVAIALERVNGSQLRLEVTDDGRGLPPGFDLQQTRSLGLKLVNTLARQLRGTLEVQSGRGASFVLHLKEARRKGPEVA